MREKIKKCTEPAESAQSARECTRSRCARIAKYSPKKWYFLPCLIFMRNSQLLDNYSVGRESPNWCSAKIRARCSARGTRRPATKWGGFTWQRRELFFFFFFALFFAPTDILYKINNSLDRTMLIDRTTLSLIRLAIR